MANISIIDEDYEDEFDIEEDIKEIQINWTYLSPEECTPDKLKKMHVVEKRLLNNKIYYFDKTNNIWDENFNLVGVYKKDKIYFLENIKNKKEITIFKKLKDVVKNKLK